jgi:hypothetical protein
LPPKFLRHKFTYTKDFGQPKMRLNNREFLNWKERGGGVGGSAGSIFKVRLGLGEIEGRDRYTEK